MVVLVGFGFELYKLTLCCDATEVYDIQVKLDR